MYLSLMVAGNVNSGNFYFKCDTTAPFKRTNLCSGWVGCPCLFSFLEKELNSLTLGSELVILEQFGLVVCESWCL